MSVLQAEYESEIVVINNFTSNGVDFPIGQKVYFLRFEHDNTNSLVFRHLCLEYRGSPYDFVHFDNWELIVKNIQTSLNRTSRYLKELR